MGYLIILIIVIILCKGFLELLNNVETLFGVVTILLSAYLIIEAGLTFIPWITGM